MVVAPVKGRKIPGEAVITMMKGTMDSTTVSENKPTEKAQESKPKCNGCYHG
jgi:hypothetical protein